MNEHTDIQELVRFVLKECGDIKYFIDVPRPFMIKIDIRKESSTMFEYILMLDKLLKKYFDVYIYDLDLRGLNLTKIPEGYLEKLHLRHLCVHFNKLTELPKLPDTLFSLHCSINKLTELPKLPKNLVKLYCFKNELRELPKIPITLRELSCSDNLLSKPPILPEDIVIISCESNPFWTQRWYDDIKRDIYRKSFVKNNQ